MRAVAFFEYGPADVLRAIDVDPPVAGSGQVRVKVRAAGVQPFDTLVRRGWMPDAVPSMPATPGNEFAGVTDDGREVLGFTTLGCYAEYVVVPDDQVVPRPSNMPWEVAGGFSAAAQTSSIAMEQLGVGPGDVFLVHGASGSVGTVLTQLARLAGATVIGTASEANQEYVRMLGAIPVVYGDGLADRVRAITDSVTVSLDAGGHGSLDVSLELVKDRERITTIADFQRAPSLGVRMLRGERSAARLSKIVDLYAQGLLKVHLREVFPLEEAAAAHQTLESGHGRGKIVLRVA
ncbi:NADP-dependent oxidoreductase [Streptosporangiaceae bacterium NEAU-GS5]|nr:NADP-dependent oxidoreductase [Streptosporangiaceae bacterium NEAU-GS5]